jgi:hypothetical protein
MQLSENLSNELLLQVKMLVKSARKSHALPEQSSNASITSDSSPYRFANLQSIKLLIVGVIVRIVLNVRLMTRVKAAVSMQSDG